MSLHQTPKLISTRQLKAARALAGLTQRDLGQLLGVDERQIRFWEKRIPRQNRKRLLLEMALEKVGVECYAEPNIGVRCLWRATVECFPQHKICLFESTWCSSFSAHYRARVTDIRRLLKKGQCRQAFMMRKHRVLKRIFWPLA